jgi:hypothetical protein
VEQITNLNFLKYFTINCFIRISTLADDYDDDDDACTDNS